MSSALRVFQGFGATALAEATRASDYRQQVAMLRSQRLEADRQIGLLTDLMEVEFEAQRELIELQRQGQDALSQAIEIQTEAIGEVEELSRTEAENANQARQELIERWTTLSETIGRFLNWFVTKALRSAGGVLSGQPIESYEDLRGWPHATGDLKLSQNVCSALPCWLLCNGTERRRDEYPELSYLIAGRYGTASEADFFKLPRKDQLTADTVILADGGLQFFIRT